MIDSATVFGAALWIGFCVWLLHRMTRPLSIEEHAERVEAFEYQRCLRVAALDRAKHRGRERAAAELGP